MNIICNLYTLNDVWNCTLVMLPLLPLCKRSWNSTQQLLSYLLKYNKMYVFYILSDIERSSNTTS